MILAPLTLFTYNRLWHTQQTIEALRNNELADASELFIFSDGPKSEADRKKVQSVREYLKTISGFKKVTIVERECNLGLAQSIITGVTEIVDGYGRIIVLEDDMRTSQYFLKFMNEALEFYKDEENVISIHGYMYPVKAKLSETFFLKGADCWGWATWKRGWGLFEPNGQKLLEELKTRDLTHRFDFNGSYDYTKMLVSQVKGENDSWAIRWYASAFLNDKLTLYPGRSLVFNTGTDASGTHCEAIDMFDTEISRGRVTIAKISLEEDTHALEAISRYFHSSRTSLGQRVVNRINKILSRYR
jgi:hypothetical protein